MKIVIMVEGATEKVFLPRLQLFLRPKLNLMPRIAAHRWDGRIPTHDKLKRSVNRLLSGQDPADHVIALTDVYTGMNPPEFVDAKDAKAKMRNWVGAEPRFHPHVANHDFEAWLLPYWPTIQKLAGHNGSRPSGKPETVNHNKPPAQRIKAVFEAGSKGNSYIKPIHAGKILAENDLALAIGECPELRALVNTILQISGGKPIS